MNFLEGEQVAMILFESGIRLLHVHAAKLARRRQRPDCRMPCTNTERRRKLAGKIAPC
jgi:hypothetical protein